MAQMQVGQQAIANIREWANRLGNVIVPIGEAAILHIKERTLSGLDRDGNKFRPYSDKYARRKGVSQTQVNLYDTGEMLGALYVAEGSGSRIDTALGGGQIRGSFRGQTESIRDTNVQIMFNNPDMAQRATYHVGPGAYQRDFMGLGELWVQEKVDLELRKLAPPTSVNEVVQVRVL